MSKKDYDLMKPVLKFLKTHKHGDKVIIGLIFFAIISVVFMLFMRSDLEISYFEVGCLIATSALFGLFYESVPVESILQKVKVVGRNKEEKSEKVEAAKVEEESTSADDSESSDAKN